MNKQEKERFDLIEQRIDSNEISDQKFWQFIHELNSYSKERLEAVALNNSIRTYSYGEMFAEWERYARVFSGLGITGKNRSTVGLFSGTYVETIFAIFAANMTGATVSNIVQNEVLNRNRMQEIIRIEQITDLVIHPLFIDLRDIQYLIHHKEELGIRNIIILESELKKTKYTQQNIINDYQRVHSILRRETDVLFMNDLFDTYEKTRIAKSKTLNDVATISHTSGTIKGIHKPIPLSDRQLNEACARFLHIEDFVKFKQSSFLMGLSPTAGIYPLVNAMMLPLAYGCHIVILPGEVMMNPMAIEALVEFKIRVFFSFPRIIEVMMRFENFGPKIDLSNMDFIVLGAAAVSADMRKRFNKYLKDHGSSAKVVVGYGLSECCGACILTKEGDETDSIGYPLPGVEVKIFDEQEKKFYDVKDGERVGGLYIHSPSNSSGKIGDTVFFEPEMIDGKPYICTYDLVRVDKNGSLTCCGRMNKYFVNNEGVRFDSGLVEYSVATQKDIESCGIAPEYDRMLHDTIPVLYIQPVKKGKAGVDAVRNALINVFINEHKSEETNLPSKCVITYELPYNHNGKVDIFKITTSKPKGQTYTIDPVRKDGKLINVRLELPNNPFGFERVGVPEELQQDVDTYLSRFFRFGQNDDKNKNMSPLMGCNPMSLVNMVMSQDEGKKPSFGCNPRRPEKKKKETENKEFRPFMPLMGCNPMNALRPLPGCNPRKKTK